MIEFNTHDVLCLVSSIVGYSVCFMYCVYWQVSFDTWYVLCNVQGYRFEVFMVIVYKAPINLTSLFKTYYSLDLDKADFNRQSLQYT